jgi:hypothetical protein
MQDEFRANAEKTVQGLGRTSGIKFGYDRESVEWMEGYIERIRQSGNQFDTDAARQALTRVLGSFVGECIIRCYGGKWTQQGGFWGVVFNSGDFVNPFAKVHKQLQNGREAGDGVGGFFSFIPEVFRVDTPPADAKPWWKSHKVVNFGDKGKP